MTDQTLFNIAQMASVIQATWDSGGAWAPGSPGILSLEDIAHIICEATKLPMISILSQLQELAEHREALRREESKT